jgi:hypothetical protein
MSNEGKRISAKRKFSLSNYAAESAVTALPHMFRPQSLFNRMVLQKEKNCFKV